MMYVNNDPKPVCVSLRVFFHFRKNVYALHTAERKEPEERLKTQPFLTYAKNCKTLPFPLPLPGLALFSGGYFVMAYHSV